MRKIQELNAELLDDMPGALWNRALIEAARAPIGFTLPHLMRVVVAIDPAVSSGEDASTHAFALFKFTRSMANANPTGWTAVLFRLAPFEAHGEQKCSERLHWSQRDARREAEGWARTMGQRPIRWELLDDNMALGRIDDHVVLVRSIMLPPANHWT